MINISIELVPRTEEQLLQDLQVTKETAGEINMVNIPDLLRFDLRSWEACKICKTLFKKPIPHIRAIDFNLKESFLLKDFLVENEITDLLIVRGDDPQDMSRKIYPTSTIDLAHKIKTELSHIKLYGALDPYRQGIKEELDYFERKKEAGIDGFFSQPFFDMRLAEIFAEKLEGENIYFGVSPVTSEKSQLYWETRNHAIFPKSFSPNQEWNIQLAREMLQFCRSNNFNMYLMPIRTNLQKYLQGIFQDP